MKKLLIPMILAVLFFYVYDAGAQTAVELNNAGEKYFQLGQYDKAIENFRQALAINRKLGQEDKVAIDLNNIGEVYRAWGQYDKAIEHYRQALATFKKLGKEAEIATILNNIGSVYHAWGQYDKAIEHYRQALAIAQKLGKEAEIATDLNNIGSVYHAWGQYDKAIEHFVISVELKEKLRKTAIGDARRDYLSSQVYTYQLLISAHILNGSADKAFAVMEQSRARLLAERLGGMEMDTPRLDEVRKSVGGDMVLLSYANAEWVKLAQVSLTAQAVAGREIDVISAISPALQKFDAELKANQEKQRGIKVVKTTQGKLDLAKAGDNKRKGDFENLVNYYRLLLSDPDARNDARRREIARVLYDLLIAPARAELKGKTSLLIIPDGILNYLPFETLIDPEGRYLVETFDISYAPSAQILGLLRGRKYPAERKPLLAFGGGVYDPQKYAVDMVQNSVQLASLEKQVMATIAQRGSVRAMYAELGKGEWDNLPGSLAEVREIGRIMKGADIITGKNVTEGRVKSMSANGDLARYKVLHFATHGLVVPEIPELSAVVLSQLKDGEKNEDGYLRMGEIATLELQADFVNLSACETGLGRIYGGEGVVGLSQAFLLAGANSISVSLWPVADESTAVFMMGVYRLVNEQGLSYTHAVNTMKRKFIRGKVEGGLLETDRGIKVSAKSGTSSQYTHPYHWGPFVLYGDTGVNQGNQKIETMYLQSGEKNNPVQADRQSGSARENLAPLEVPNIAGKSQTPAPQAMAMIQGGSFYAGLQDITDNPVHTLKSGAFYMDKHEVTQSDYERVMISNPSKFKGGNLPVESVTWYEAREYCAKAGKRLPTEWEWEFASKGGTTTAWHWGDSPDDAYGWWYGNSGNKTHPVGEKKPNNYDLYDMAGNVWEWTSSDYDKSGKTKVLRGGSWSFTASSARSAYRHSNVPGHRYDYVGFRCAR